MSPSRKHSRLEGSDKEHAESSNQTPEAPDYSPLSTSAAPTPKELTPRQSPLEESPQQEHNRPFKRPRLEPATPLDSDCTLPDTDSGPVTPQSANNVADDAGHAAFATDANKEEENTDITATPATHSSIKTRFKAPEKLTKAEALGQAEKFSREIVEFYRSRGPGSLSLDKETLGDFLIWFRRAKEGLGPSTWYLSSSELGFDNVTQCEMVRKINYVTFFSGIFASEVSLSDPLRDLKMPEVRLSDLDDRFIDIFVAENGRLLKEQAELHMELKTQAFISDLQRLKSEKPIAILDRLFSRDVASQIRAKRPNGRELRGTELLHIEKLKTRRGNLKSYIESRRGQTPDDTYLSETYKWVAFKRQAFAYFMSNSGSPEVITAHSTRRLERYVNRPLFSQQDMENIYPLNDTTTPKPEYIEPASIPTPLPSSSTEPSGSPDAGEGASTTVYTANAEKAFQAMLRLSGDASSYYGYASPNYQPPPPPSYTTPPANPPTATTFHQYVPPELSGTVRQASTGLPKTKSQVVNPQASTRVLFERARQIAQSNNSLPLYRAPPLDAPGETPVTWRNRRLWTSEEEHALLDGLDHVQGPHWAQILHLYGRGGTVSEALKDRDQVQLKDKARNLKIFFMKNGVEVPVCLQNVTGDPKKRQNKKSDKNEAGEGEG